MSTILGKRRRTQDCTTENKRPAAGDGNAPLTPLSATTAQKPIEQDCAVHGTSYICSIYDCRGIGYPAHQNKKECSYIA